MGNIFAQYAQGQGPMTIFCLSLAARNRDVPIVRLVLKEYGADLAATDEGMSGARCCRLSGSRRVPKPTSTSTPVAPGAVDCAQTYPDSVEVIGYRAASGANME